VKVGIVIGKVPFPVMTSADSSSPFGDTEAGALGSFRKSACDF